MSRARNLIFALVLAISAQIAFGRIVSLPDALASHQALVSVISILVVATIFRPAGINFATLPLSLLLTGWGVIYFAVVFISRESIFAETRALWMLVPEIIILTAIIVLTHQLSRRLQRIDDLVGTVVLGEEKELPEYPQETALDIRRELRRSRQYNRPLGLVVLNYDQPQSAELYQKVAFKVQKSLVERYMRLELATLLQRELRLMDLVVEQTADKQIIIMCPEMNAQEVEALAHHLQAIIRDELEFNINGAAASFPTEGFTYDSLVQNALSKLEQTDPARATERPMARKFVG